MSPPGAPAEHVQAAGVLWEGVGGLSVSGSPVLLLSALTGFFLINEVRQERGFRV